MGGCKGGRDAQPGGPERGQEGQGHGKAIASGDTSSLAANSSQMNSVASICFSHCQ